MKAGLFWIINSNKGELQNEYEVVAYFDDLATHSSAWELNKQERKEFNSIDYNHYPHGRVWASHGIVMIVIDSLCNVPQVIDSIIKAFELEGNIEILQE